MNHESDPPEQPVEKVPAPEMPPEGEIDRLEQDYKDQQREEELRRQQEHRKMDENMNRISDELARQREEEEKSRKQPLVFETPARVEELLETKTQEFEEAYDRLDSQGIYTRQKILEMLAEQGLYPPDTSEEIEAEEVRRISNHASTAHKPKTTKSKTLRRPLGPAQQEIADSDKRVESTYGKRDETS